MGPISQVGHQRQKDRKIERRYAIIGFDDRERGCHCAEECRQTLEAGKGKQTDSPVETPKGMLSYRHLDSSLV